MAEIKKWEEIGLDHALMFNLVMSKPENCRIFLERALDIKLKELVVVASEKSIETGLGMRGIRLDVYAEDDKGTAYDLEMQAINLRQWDIAKRTRYYQSKIDEKALQKNEDYDKLRKSYIIFVCTFDPFGKNLGRYTFKECCLELENERLILANDATHVFINVTGDIKKLSKELQNVIKYIRDGKPNDDYTNGLHNDVEGYRRNAEEARAYMTVEDYAKDRAKEAREEERKEIAINMIKAGMLNAEILKIIPSVSEEFVEELRKAIA